MSCFRQLTSVFCLELLSEFGHLAKFTQLHSQRENRLCDEAVDLDVLCSCRDPVSLESLEQLQQRYSRVYIQLLPFVDCEFLMSKNDIDTSPDK